MDFESRLQRAIDRGNRSRHQQQSQAAQQAATEEELKALHRSARLDLSEHIEHCLQKLTDHFPGFRFETIIGEDGWGARIRRDDLAINKQNPRDNFYSQLEMVVRPVGPSFLVDLSAKGTIHNKEVFSRNHFQQINELDVQSFSDLIDLWVLEYAEAFSAKG